jgi:hypothetical protein
MLIKVFLYLIIFLYVLITIVFYVLIILSVIIIRVAFFIIRVVIKFFMEAVVRLGAVMLILTLNIFCYKL